MSAVNTVNTVNKVNAVQTPRVGRRPTRAHAARAMPPCGGRWLPSIGPQTQRQRGLG
ncbi:MAG: hypothetical protein ACKO9Q_21735 [Pirellula sp.]